MMKHDHRKIVNGPTCNSYNILLRWVQDLFFKVSCIEQKWKSSEGFGREEDGRERGMRGFIGQDREGVIRELRKRIADISNIRAIDHLLAHRSKNHFFSTTRRHICVVHTSGT